VKLTPLTWKVVSAIQGDEGITCEFERQVFRTIWTHSYSVDVADGHEIQIRNAGVDESPFHLLMFEPLPFLF
jgi:hypothetical protein